MSSFRLTPALLLLLCLSFSVVSQQAAEPELAPPFLPAGESVSQEEPSSAEPPSDEPSSEGEEEPERTLFEKTLLKDIETAGYYELVAWMRSLGLSDEGDSARLRQLLYNYYELQPEPRNTVGDNVSLITVRSAVSTSYFTIEEKDEQMIVLKGDVLVEMEESGANPRRHIIRADELLFNQAEQLITASGNLEYRLKSGESEDVFYGDSLSFSVSSWNGVIFKGSSLREEVIEGEAHTFYFNGETIRKSGKGGIFILEEGVIKTQERDDPDFHLEASKLWLMGPREWGVLHGVLYIGHVPVLYIPFYYKPGNEMFFNPVIGTRSREGVFLQTTTYLMGRKKPSEGFSFFQLGDQDESNYRLVREGLYLMKTQDAPTETESEDFLKIMADGYSRLGAYTGISGGFYEKGKLSSLEFTAGIGVSRTIDDSGNVFFKNGDEFRSDWNSTVLGDSVIPFRWGQSLSFSTGDFKGDIRFYSDPFFNQDFLDREETFDWLNTILTSDMSDDNRPDTITDMDWTLSYSRTFKPSFLSPVVSSVALNPVRLNVEWNRKTNKDTSLENSNDPSREFFYPEKFNLPYANVTVSGTPFSYSTRDGWGWKERQKDEEETERPDELLPPWETAADEEKKEESTAGDLKPGDYWGELFQNPSPVLYENSFTYNYNTLFNFENITGYADWDKPGDIQFVMDESILLSNNKLTTQFNNKFFDNTLGLKNDNSFTANYRKHLSAMGADDSDLEYEDLKSDYQYHSVNWDNKFNAYYYPLKSWEDFSSSRVDYDLDNLLYRKSFDSYEEGGDPVYDIQWASWDEDYVDRHNMGFLLKYSPDYFYLSEDVKYDLPPLDRKETYTSTAGVDVFNWKSSLSQTTTLAEEEWTYNPLIFSTSYKPMDKISLVQELEYSFEEHTLSKSRSYINLYGVFFEYVHELTTPYEWSTDELTWVSDDEAFVPSRVKTGYTVSFEGDPFWKNRVTYKTDLKLDWAVNLQQFNNNVLSFSWTSRFHVFEFMDFQFGMTSSNKNMYLYIPYYRDKLGIEEDFNFFGDLFKSFNIFSSNQQDRYDSYFNLEKINLELVHNLREWDLTLSYTGWPKLDGNSYKWNSEFSIFLIWNPLPQIKSNIQYKEEIWSVDNR